MYVTSDQFWQLQLVVSAIESDLHALWSVEVVGLVLGFAVLTVMLLNVVLRRR